jgi:hypothetical protein
LQLPATTCNYLRLYRYRPGLKHPQKGEDFNAKARRCKGAKRIGPLPSSFFLLPCPPAPFPLRVFKEQARERHTNPTIPRFCGNAKYIFYSELTAEHAEHAEVEGGAARLENC